MILIVRRFPEEFNGVRCYDSLVYGMFQAAGYSLRWLPQDWYTTQPRESTDKEETCGGCVPPAATTVNHEKDKFFHQLHEYVSGTSVVCSVSMHVCAGTGTVWKSCGKEALSPCIPGTMRRTHTEPWAMKYYQSQRTVWENVR